MHPTYLVTFSYAFSAAAFALLAVLLLTSWKGRLQGGLLVLAAVGTAAWAALIAAQGDAAGLDARWIFGAEIMRDALWLLFLLHLITGAALGRKTWLPLLVFAVLVAATAWSLVQAERVTLATWRVSEVLLIALVATAVYGLVLIEQLYRNTKLDYRWHIKFLCIGLGIMFVHDLYMYSHALLVQSLDHTLWWIRGLINALAVPFIMVAAARNPQWSLDVFVSRKVVFHSFALIAAGVYLLFMASAGYVLKIQGGTWGAALQTIFLFGAGLVLLLVMASGQIRAHVKVFLSKHFYNFKYDYREEWLRLTRILSATGTGDDLSVRAIHCLAQIVESRGGILLMRDAAGDYLMQAQWHVDDLAGNLQSGDDLLRYLKTRKWVLDLSEYKAKPDVYDSVALPEWLLGSQEAWLVIPLFHTEGMIGIVVLSESRAPRDLDWEDFDILKTASAQVASHLAQHRAAEELAGAKQFEAYNRVSAFIMHDLKNVIGQLSLVADNAKKHKLKPEFVEDAFNTVENAVTRMKRLLNQLKTSRDLNISSRVDITELVGKIVQERSLARPAPTLARRGRGYKVMGNPDRLASVIGNVIQNAQDATPDDGFVRVSIYSEVSEVVVRVEDNGEGMSEGFIREKLFKPFHSTKGEAGMGIGAYEARDYVHTLGGRMVVDSKRGKGTVISMRFPKVHTDTVEKVA